jgi:hypothetical protein
MAIGVSVGAPPFFSRAIVGGHAATVKDTALVTTALKMALWRHDHADRGEDDGLIHHNDAGSQVHVGRFAETLVLDRSRNQSAVSAMPQRWGRH